ncbi:hypothetical protein M378DRAFT_16396 [Amanita muscaria Koide BX008]|uniref:Uncharacterized protein n=1 Tax=Amanita muscaria (strain Koide BX008) TaxID=946122 RepID=A0A0C2WKI2_AMAMK|nr:hypothetical protein M378DRAFT_16396 [Amanita muscaria Koide BX008]
MALLTFISLPDSSKSCVTELLEERCLIIVGPALHINNAVFEDAGSDRLDIVLVRPDELFDTFGTMDEICLAETDLVSGRDRDGVMFNDLMERIEWFFNLHDKDKDGHNEGRGVEPLSESLPFIFQFEIGDAYLGAVIALEEFMKPLTVVLIHHLPSLRTSTSSYVVTTLVVGHSSLIPGYLNTNQISCAWILRYLSAAAVLSRKTSSSQTALGSPLVSSRVRTALRQIVKVIQTEEYQYQDPVLTLLKELDLSERLNSTRDEGEKWIVNLIRETHMGADVKIDLEKNVIEINRPPQLVYQSVTDKTRALRTQTIGAAVARVGAVLLEKQMQTQG